MGRYKITYKDGSTAILSASSPEAARRRASVWKPGQKAFQGGGVDSVTDESSIQSHTFVSSGPNQNVCTKCGKKPDHPSHARAHDGELYR